MMTLPRSNFGGRFMGMLTESVAARYDEEPILDVAIQSGKKNKLDFSLQSQ